MHHLEEVLSSEVHSMLALLPARHHSPLTTNDHHSQPQLCKAAAETQAMRD